ncbi:hypothetical protein fugu_018787 [Takifugu bimaculatus]|uniref:Fibronectin type-III domain-containing protein n=1 Tax=Takifugu bimaculatus TaxID=433685 RepID=A0A4Z2BJK2_9TELE|nr:hypothetical protein fugu_018787 [Takifugu bimaculatus]
MLSSCRTTAPLLLLMTMMTIIMMSTLTQAQSGDEEIAPRTSCTSHITTGTSTLTCNVVTDDNDSEDDEDVEDDSIEEMKACYFELNKEVKCLNSFGNTINLNDLSPIININVTLGLKSGRTTTKEIDLKKIVKPRSPQVWNVTIHREPYEAVIHVRTPYEKDYLTTEKQLFQLFIWSATQHMIQNISLLDKIVLKIGEAHLEKNTMYQVKVRSIPQKYLQGTWSEWSKPYNFSTPAGKSESINYAGKIPITNLWETYPLIVCFALILVVTSSVILSWRNKIFTYMWPTIPHPKGTLVQSCNPNTGLLLNVKPDVFSVLKVYSIQETDVGPDDKSEPLVAADKDRSCFPCSSQSSDCSGSANSVSTEDLALSGLLSRSSFEEEDSLQSAARLPVELPGMLQPVCDSEEKRSVFGTGKQEEAYVTMSSFYQINKSVQKE